MSSIKDDDGGRGALVVKKRKPPEPKAAAPKQPPKFKVVDVMTKQVLAEGASARVTIELLEGLRSVVDVNLYLWQATDGTWRKLSQHESQTLWGMRGRMNSGG